MSSRPDCIFEIHQLWQSGFSRVYSNLCCSISFEAEIIKIGQLSHKMYSNNIVNFQESTTILNACTKKSLETYCMHLIYHYFFKCLKSSFISTFFILPILIFSVSYRLNLVFPLLVLKLLFKTGFSVLVLKLVIYSVPFFLMFFLYFI